MKTNLFSLNLTKSRKIMRMIAALTPAVALGGLVLAFSGCTTVVDEEDRVDSVSRTTTESASTPFGGSYSEKTQTTTVR